MDIGQGTKKEVQSQNISKERAHTDWDINLNLDLSETKPSLGQASKLHRTETSMKVGPDADM